jgi:hypothetical protein
MCKTILMDPDGTLHPANMARLVGEQYLKTNKVRKCCSFLHTYTPVVIDMLMPAPMIVLHI